MPVRYWFYSLAVGLGCALGHVPAQAQCLPLRVLHQSFATGRILPDSVDALLSTQEWVRHYGSSSYWTPRTDKPNSAKNRPEAWVEVRRTNKRASYDLIYKTTRYACLAQLRTELLHQVSLRAEPVTCIQCEAERLVGYDYTITIFNQKTSYAAKRTAFPYVLVMRRTVAEMSEEDPASEVSSQVADKP